MSRNSTPALLLPLTAILAIAFPFAFNVRMAAPPQQETGVPRSEHVASSDHVETPTPTAHDANRILTEFFGIKELRSLRNPGNGFRSKYQIECMIVTIPDPIDSRLPYLFDRFLASIQRGAEADNLVLDRYDLPWLEEKQSTVNRQDVSLSAASSAESASHLHDKQPGLLLFRDTFAGGGPRLLVLFLVGETPTTGISKEAFLSALTQIEELGKIFEGDNPSLRLYIPILGPSFSGSAESLDFALQSWLLGRQHLPGPHAPVDFKIVSGSATAIRTAPTDVRDRYYFTVPQELGTAEFESTVVPDGLVTLPRFLDFVRSREFSPDSRPITIGFLTESNTAYGAAVRSALQAKTGTSLSLPFPLHISRLRSETEKTRRAREQSSQQASTNTNSSRYLPVPFADENENARDSVPAVSDLDITSAELILANLLSTISREQCDYVGIAATDVRDTIFLAREIREHSPSSVIFSFNADLIYTHPEANPNTRGMLVVTPYPVFTLNQRWMNPFSNSARLQFPDQNSEGVYNALLLLLRKPSGEASGKPSDKSSGNPLDLLDYGVPFDRSSDNGQQSPPIWITTVGRQGFWPIAVFPPEGPDNYTHREAGTPNPSGSIFAYNLDRGMISHAAILVYSCWGLLCLVPSLIFLRRRLQRRFPGSKILLRDFGFAELPMLRAPRFSRNDSECSAYYLVGGVAALSAYIIAVSAFAITENGIASYAGEIWYHRLAVSGMYAVLVFSFVACLVLTSDTISLTHKSGESSTNGWLAYPVVIISATSLTLASWLASDWLTLHAPGKPGVAEIPNRVVTGFRVLNIFSGVSPLLPLLFIALAACVWALSAVRRVHLAESLPWMTRPECEDPADTSRETNEYALFNSAAKSFQPFRALESQIQRMLRSPSLHLPGPGRTLSFLIAGVILIAGVYLCYFRLVVALEPPSFYIFFAFSSLLVYLSIAFNIMRLLFLWLSLKRVLDALNRHPIRAAFARFHRSFPNLPHIGLATAPSPLAALHFSILQAKALIRSTKFLLPSKGNLICRAAAAAPHIDEAEARYQEAVDAESVGEGCKYIVTQLAAEGELAQASRLVEESLDQASEADFNSPGPDPAIQEKRDNLVADAQEFLVGRTVLFLSHVFPQMTNLAGLSLTSLLLLLLAVSCYPFQPHQLIVTFIWILILSFAAVSLYVFVQMNRDALLSNLNGTKPGEINWDRDFVTRIFLYVVVPILGFLGVQFPDTIGQIFSFLSPGAAGHG